MHPKTAQTMMRDLQQHEYRLCRTAARYKRIKPRLRGRLPHAQLRNRKLSSTIFRLRTGHTRFDNPRHAQRCPSCNAPDSVEHLLLACSDARRQVLIDKVCNHLDTPPPTNDADTINLLLGVPPGATKSQLVKVATMVAEYALTVRGQSGV